VAVRGSRTAAPRAGFAEEVSAYFPCWRGLRGWDEERRLAEHLARSRGFGREHVSDSDYEHMLDWLRANHTGRLPSAAFRDDATNSGMERI